MKEALTRKLGPLPVWGWAVLIALALVVLVVLKGRNKAASNTAASNLTPPTIFQFTPPVQEDEDQDEDEDEERKHRHKKHPRRRPHPIAVTGLEHGGRAHKDKRIKVRMPTDPRLPSRAAASSGRPVTV